MGKIIWCIEHIADNGKNVIKNHEDDIQGALELDDRFGDCAGTHEDYNLIVRKLFKRVSTYKNESYSATFSDSTVLILQTNIANNDQSSVFSIMKQ